ncbi:MAG TPA: branched-chain amino acid ABC transporter permease [Actinophytocola sp.]|uniref:branched-chain amino acid ABC transporter permease n=1 Tax=Actinophytocola sp. TaxID=1872138 RepID=UPI002DDDAB81|nr:branched-chain amino acid ABC transporter permease [Actinophytocola sp.]HEV2778704.1 branched-chain amino acid ABC transporter permease [Actinophytocola sp.]
MSDRVRLLLWPPVVLLALAAPLELAGFWLQTGLFAMAAVIGAIGLTLLVGVTGQLSLGHAFFVAVGAYGYAYLAGIGWPPPLAAIGAVALAGLAGALFSPIAGRLRGIYLGLTSLGLVFLGQHILTNATAVTGGFNGRDAAPFNLFGFSFTATDPELTVLDVPFGPLERLWYLGLLLVAVSWWYAGNLARGRPGRALVAVRDSEVAAAVMGVDVRRYKAAAFTVSSAYAGLAGVLLALAFGRIVPESFGFLLSIDFLAMIIIGGLGSIGGAAAGAVFVTALPLVLNHYSDALPFLAQPGEAGIGAAEAARLLYGAAIVVVLLFAPGGLAQLARRIRTPRSARHEPTTAGLADRPAPRADGL